MKLQRTKNKLTIELEEGENFSNYDCKERYLSGKSIQIWIQVDCKE